MKKILAALLAAIMLIPFAIIGVAEESEAYIGGRFAGQDPWGNPLTIEILSIEGGKMAFTYTEDFEGQTLSQTFDDTALADGVAEFHVEAAIDGDENTTCDYTGTLTLADGAVTVAYASGEMTESSSEGGSTAYHVDALDEADRAVTLVREAQGEKINTLLVEGSFVIQVDVSDGDDGWVADDMAQDPTVVALYDADIIEDTYVARYDAVADGEVTVGLRHMDGDVCDEAYTYDLLVKDGAVQEVTGGSYTASPDEAEQDPYISGEWQVNDAIMAGLTITKNAGVGWALQIATAYPDVHVLKANIRYDCELDTFVYYDGVVYESEITNSPEVVVGDVVKTDVYGTLTIAQGSEGDLELTWYNSLSPEETATFHRPM